MIRPGPRLPGAILGVAGVALLLPIVPEVTWAIALLLAALLAASAWEWRRLRGARLDVTRPEAVVLSLDEPDVVTLDVRSSGPWAIDAVLRQPWPTLVDERSTTRRVRLPARSRLRLDLPVRAVERGHDAIPPASVAATSWGLVERIVDVGEPVPLTVLPNVRAAARLEQELRRFALRGAGARVAPRLGRGREFDRLRDHVAGDDLRDIAWKASGRHGKLITREYRIERSQDVVACVDRGHRMAVPVGRLTRLDHALDAALLVARAAATHEDRVGMVAFAATAEMGVAPGRGRAHARALVTFASRVRAEHVHSDHAGLAARLRRGLGHRTLVLLLTALPEGDEADGLVAAVGLLIPKHLPIVVVMTDPGLAAVASVAPGTFPELCRSLVARDLESRRRTVVARLRHLGALVVEARPGDAGLAAVNAYLDAKRRQLL